MAGMQEPATVPAHDEAGAIATTAVTAVIVCYDESAEELRAAIDGLLAQTRPPAEIVVVDNGPEGRLAKELGGCAGNVKALASGANLGYPAGVNLAASKASGDYLFCLNPDARAEADCVERLVAVAESDPKIAIVGAQILLEDGQTTNAGANPLHPTGISPSGGYGERREHGEPRDVIVVSGACCLIRRDAFDRLGGFVSSFFLYYDDADLGWRARIAGLRVVYCPQATVRHHYEFARRGRKWFYLERNRIFSVLANYELRTLLLLAPLLLTAELGLLAVAALQGWFGQKLRAYGSIVALRGELRSQRRAVQASRRRRDGELFTFFEDRFDSPLLPSGPAALASLLGAGYMRFVRAALTR
jgi:GT2 family glycosyltransferase